MEVEYTARAIITLGSYVLLTRAKSESYWILPGGHCEAGETPGDAVRREIQEETGREISDLRYLATLQNDFEKRGEHIREEMALFKATLYPRLQEDPAQSAEDHLVFAWCPIAECEMWNIKPPAVIPYITLVGGA